jgi:molybdopterin molybdotransferase
LTPAPISLQDAQAAVKARCAPLESETVKTSEAAGRVLARDFVAPSSMPAFANSAMDGFALRAADSADASPATPAALRLIGESRAGRPFDGTLPAQGAIRISTGASMPDGADCVLRVENSVVSGDELRLEKALQAGNDVRPAGDDIAAGQTTIASGTPLGSGELALANALGAQELEVVRRPLVGLITTGDEVVPPGEPLQPGQIYDSNSAMLRALIDEHGGELQAVRPRVADSLQSVTEALEATLPDADVVVLCGGVSMGEHDHVKPALQTVGAQQVFWQVALRPGHPTWFGTHERADGRTQLIFGLPGNPVSAWVTFQLFVAPALRLLRGIEREPLRLNATYSGDELKKRAGFAQVLRCRLTGGGDELQAELTSENQRSHALSSLVGADALMFLPPETERLQNGERVATEALRQ